MSKFKVGDNIRVIDRGRTYSTYTNLFKKLGFKNTSINKAPSHRSTAKIFAIGTHQNGETLLACENRSKQFLIGLDGVELITTTPRQFKVGDIVKANVLANKRYAITRSGWVGKVVSITNIDYMVVASLSGSESFSVLKKCFDLSEFEVNFAKLAVDEYKKLGVKKDSYVLVASPFASGALGWNGIWSEEHSKSLGKKLKVYHVGLTSITLENGLKYPAFALEICYSTPTEEVKLNSEYTAVVDFDKKSIQVGCQTIPFSSVKKLHSVITKK